MGLTNRCKLCPTYEGGATMKEKTLPVIEFFSREVLRRGEDLPARSSINSRIGQFINRIPPRDIQDYCTRRSISCSASLRSRG